jgi:hypothetical protein
MKEGGNMAAFKDLTGQTNGDWTVLQRVNPPEDAKVKNRPWYLLGCKRGHYKIVKGQDFASGGITNCHECMAIEREEKALIEKESYKIIMKEKCLNKVGEESMSNDGTIMRIIEYRNCCDVLIEFQDEFKYRTSVEYGNFQKGTVKNPYHKLLYGKGYIGDGEYRPSINRVATKEYEMWRKMFDRCYSGKQLAYSDCEVCEEWYNFQNFAKWYTENYYEVPDQIMQIDKDWLCIGNRIYCPERCSIVPHVINSCILTHSKINNLELPSGVSRTTSGKFKARCSVEGERKDLGTYETIQEAWEVYKNFKIKYVTSLAERFKDCLPKNIYEAVSHYGETFNERYKFNNETICELS